MPASRTRLIPSSDEGQGQGRNGGIYGDHRLFDIENADGSNSADTILGSDVANRLGGAGGVDRIYGNDGDDVLAGGLGNDSLYGDAGFDIADFALGQAVVVDLSLANDTATRGSEVDRLRGIEGRLGPAAPKHYGAMLQLTCSAGKAARTP